MVLKRNNAQLIGQELLHTLAWICQGTDAKMRLDMQEISWKREQEERQGELSDCNRGLISVEGEKKESQTIVKFQERFKPMGSPLNKVIFRGVLHLTE